MALFRPSQMVPAGGPAAVQWQHSVVMVICSFQKPMDWLQSQEMAPMLANVDLAIYAKGNKTFDVSALSKNLRFFKRVPNFGLSGGSREPYIYFDFMLDFYENLPSSAVSSRRTTSPSGCGSSTQTRCGRPTPRLRR